MFNKIIHAFILHTCKRLNGSFKITGNETFDKSFPIALRKIPQMLICEVSGAIAGKCLRLFNIV